MSSRSAYFKEYNQRPKRKEYILKKNSENYHKNKKGVGIFVCPNCQTVQEFNLTIKKNFNLVVKKNKKVENIIS